jgi:hypothetical protein
MTERYLDALTVHLRGYTDGPIPKNLTEEIVLRVGVGAQVDLEQLVDELKKDVGSNPRRVLQTITETSWGASGAVAELIIEIPTVLTGIASLPVLWDMISRRILRHGQPLVLDPQLQAELARTWLAQSHNLAVSEIKIIRLEPVGDGHRVELEAPTGIFDVETNSRGVTRMHPR